MANPRDVNIDIVGHNRLGRATRAAENDLDRLGRRTEELNKRFKKTSASIEEMSKKDRLIDKLGDKVEKFSGKLLKLTAAGAAAVPAVGALQPVVAGLVAVLAPATAALGVFGAVAGTALSGIFEASGKNDDLFERIRLLRETAAVQAQRGDNEGAAKSLKAAAKASAELRARYNLLDPAQLKAVQSLDKLKNTWSEFVSKNTPRVVEDLARAFEFLNRQIPKLQPLFDAGADAVERFLGFIERKERDGTIDRFITWLTTNAGPAFDQVADAIDTSWEALKTAWKWWGDLSTAVFDAVKEIKVWVLSLQLAWFKSLDTMYSGTADFLRETATALGKIPGFSEKTKQELLKAADGLDASAQKARDKATEIQNAINGIQGKTVDVTVHYTKSGEGGYGTPYSNDPRALVGDKSRRLAFADGTDFTFSAPAGGSGRAPMPVSVNAPDVYTSVNIDLGHLGSLITARVHAVVDQRMATAARRQQYGRSV